MGASEIPRRLRLILENAPDAPSLASLLRDVDVFIPTSDPDTLRQLESDLQLICTQEIDHSRYHLQIKIFLAVLYQLLPILTPSSIIATWFEILLRPALREPKLPADAVNQAKEIILAALCEAPLGDNDRTDAEKEQEHALVRGQRRRVMDLYLLDAYNETSGDEVLDWAGLDDAEKERKACWKSNLEDVLVRLGLLRPLVSLYLLKACCWDDLLK